MSQRSTSINDMVGQRNAFFAVYAAVAIGLAFGSILMVGWIWDRVKERTPVVQTTATFNNYNPAGDYQQTQDWKDAQAAYQSWLAANPQPKNVQVLKGMDTAAIYGYMVSQVAGGLKVSCQYCHNINDFSSDASPLKVKARSMMQMAGDLNQNYVATLPASVGGYQVTCATCHNGNPRYETYPVKIQNTLPNDFRIPLDRDYPGGLVVTGRTDIGLEAVQLNQYTMYHFNVSLGQGCTFCHNSRHFPSNEIAQKNHAITMLQMVKHINDTYVAPGGDLAAGITNGKSPSCWTCHQGARVPPAAANAGQVPAMLSTTPPAVAPAAPAAGTFGFSAPANGSDVPAGELVLTGTGTPGSQVEILDGNTVIGTATVGADGNWTFPFTPEAGVITFGVREVGQTAIAATTRVRVAAPEGAPVIMQPEEGAKVPIGDITIAGTGKSGDQLEILNGDQKLGETTVGDDGRWTVTVNIPADTSASLGVRVVGTEDVVVRPIRVTVGAGITNTCTTVEPNCPAWITRQGGLRLRLRDGPSISATILNALPIGTQVQITGPATEADGNTWWPVTTLGGQTGFMAGQGLVPQPD